MFRRFVVWIAEHFPEKAVADKILPWLTVFLAMLGGFWAIREYSNDVGTARIETVLDLDQRFSTELKSEIDNQNRNQAPQAEEIVKLQCVFLKEKIAEDKLKSAASIPDCNADLSGNSRWSEAYAVQMTTELRREFRERVNAMLASRFPLGMEEIESSEKLFRFFRTVAVCVNGRNCDAATAVALFAKDITSFLNFVCPHENRLSGEGRRETVFLAKFLLDNGVAQNIHWSDDSGRENLFLCEYLRELGA